MKIHCEINMWFISNYLSDKTNTSKSCMYKANNRHYVQIRYLSRIKTNKIRLCDIIR